MFFTPRDKNPPRFQIIALLGQTNVELTLAIEPLGQLRREDRIDMLNHYDGHGKIGRQRRQNSGQGMGPAGGGTDHHQTAPLSRPRTDRPGWRWWRGCSPGFTPSAFLGDQTTHRSDLGQQLITALGRPVHPKHRRIDGIERPQPHGLEYLGGIPLHRRRDHNDGTGRALHDAPGRLDAIHHRHDQIHQNQIGLVVATAPHRFGAVVGHPGDLVARHRLEHPPQPLHGHLGVVDYGNSHDFASPINSITTFRRLSSWKLPLVR